MKRTVKITTLLGMLLYCGIVYSQEDKNEYIRSIEDALSKNECVKAKERYQWYIDDGGNPVREIETRIADCGKIDTIKESAISEISYKQMIEESLSKSDCEKTLTIYADFKALTGKADSTIEIRIIDCIESKNIQLIDSTNVKTQEMDEIEDKDNEELPVIEITSIASIEEQKDTLVNDSSDDTICSNKTRHFLIMPGIATGNTISYSILLGYMSGKFGGYAKLKSNFDSKDKVETIGSNGAYFVENYSKTGRLTISAGLLYQMTNYLYVFGGVGYGEKWVKWKMATEQLYIIDDFSYSGIEPEIGVMLKTGKIIVGAGVSALTGKETTIEANISVGLIF